MRYSNHILRTEASVEFYSDGDSVFRIRNYLMFCSKITSKCSIMEQNSWFLEHIKKSKNSPRKTSKNRKIFKILLNNSLEKLGRLCYYIPCRRDVAQFGRALRSGRKGRRFESCHPDQIKEYTHQGVFFICL